MFAVFFFPLFFCGFLIQSANLPIAVLWSGGRRREGLACRRWLHCRDDRSDRGRRRCHVSVRCAVVGWGCRPAIHCRCLSDAALLCFPPAQVVPHQGDAPGRPGCGVDPQASLERDQRWVMLFGSCVSVRAGACWWVTMAIRLRWKRHGGGGFLGSQGCRFSLPVSQAALRLPHDFRLSQHLRGLAQEAQEAGCQVSRH